MQSSLAIADVRGERELERHADAHAVQRGDHRLLQPRSSDGTCPGAGGEGAERRCCDACSTLGEQRVVDAARERRPCPAQHDDADRAVGADRRRARRRAPSSSAASIALRLSARSSHRVAMGPERSRAMRVVTRAMSGTTAPRSGPLENHQVRRWRPRADRRADRVAGSRAEPGARAPRRRAAFEICDQSNDALLPAASNQGNDGMSLM